MDEWGQTISCGWKFRARRLEHLLLQPFLPLLQSCFRRCFQQHGPMEQNEARAILRRKFALADRPTCQIPRRYRRWLCQMWDHRDVYWQVIAVQTGVPYSVCRRMVRSDMVSM